ncbi:MAG: hypothetical protein HY816_01050 [Candidatus Wallbacteria bacterium]|nr:hypothetical protein [Candidatus Wallbacteria bacterium]
MPLRERWTDLKSRPERSTARIEQVTAVPHRSPKIDRDKLRTMLRKLGHEYVFYILDDAIELLPGAKLKKIVGQYIPLERLAPDEDSQASPGLLLAGTAFDTASRAGKYFESFRVNSQNYTKQSMGTTAWIAECRVLRRSSSAP